MDESMSAEILGLNVEAVESPQDFSTAFEETLARIPAFQQAEKKETDIGGVEVEFELPNGSKWVYRDTKSFEGGIGTADDPGFRPATTPKGYTTTEDRTLFIQQISPQNRTAIVETSQTLTGSISTEDGINTISYETVEDGRPRFVDDVDEAKPEVREMLTELASQAI